MSAVFPTVRLASRAPAVAAMVLALLTAGGGRSGSTSGVAPDSSARSQALIEAGNQAYRTGDYGLAARRYAAAVVVKKDDPAAYYGLGMALAKLGRDEEARAAYARARELARKHELERLHKAGR